MTLIVSVDPGKVTGISAVRYTADTRAEVVRSAFVDYGEMPCVAASVRTQLQGLIVGGLMYQGLYQDYPDESIVMIVERFVPERSAHGFDATPIEIIGEIRADMRDNAEWTRHVSAWHWPLRTAKEMVTGDVLRRLNLWQTRKAERRLRHVNDSLRHTVGYLLAVNHRPTALQGWPNQAKTDERGPRG